MGQDYCLPLSCHLNKLGKGNRSVLDSEFQAFLPSDTEEQFRYFLFSYVKYH